MKDRNVPDNLQVYVTGHKNSQSLNRTLNSHQKYGISNMLTNHTYGTENISSVYRTIATSNQN